MMTPPTCILIALKAAMWLHHVRLRFIQGSLNIAVSWCENPAGTIDSGENGRPTVLNSVRLIRFRTEGALGEM